MTAFYFALVFLIGGFLGSIAMAVLTGCRDRGLDDDDIDRIAGIVLSEMRRAAAARVPTAAPEDVLRKIRRLDGDIRPHGHSQGEFA